MSALTKRVGILGSGQLAWLLNESSRNLNIQTKVVGAQGDPAQRNSSSFLDSIDEAEIGEFFRDCDVLTLESEFHSVDYLREIEKLSGKTFYPHLESYDLINTKLKEKVIFNKYFKVIPFYESPPSFPCMMKHSSGGYDGYGNTIIKDESQSIASSKEHFFEPLLDIKREIATIAFSNQDSVVVYPFVETIQRNSQCFEVKIIQQDFLELREKIKQVMKDLDYIGSLAFEFIQTKDNNIYFNETAPRVHNSFHLSSDCFEISQFENHLRSITGLEILQPGKVSNFGGMINLSFVNRPKNLSFDFQSSEIQVYDYQKTFRPNRKMGHINYRADNKLNAQALRSQILMKLEKSI